jgi:hypothetical protein
LTVSLPTQGLGQQGAVSSDRIGTSHTRTYPPRGAPSLERVGSAGSAGAESCTPARHALDPRKAIQYQRASGVSGRAAHHVVGEGVVLAGPAGEGCVDQALVHGLQQRTRTRCLSEHTAIVFSVRSLCERVL